MCWYWYACLSLLIELLSFDVFIEKKIYNICNNELFIQWMVSHKIIIIIIMVDYNNTDIKYYMQSSKVLFD